MLNSRRRWFSVAANGLFLLMGCAAVYYALLAIPKYNPHPYTTDIIDRWGIPMRYVPAGTFLMGSDDGDPDEQPMHEVYLDAYYIDKYEVTNYAYKMCVIIGKCDPPNGEDSIPGAPYYFDSLYYYDYPVVYVDWNMAQEFCKMRGATLPTEAQWEKAARGTTAREYPWGYGISCDYANYYKCPHYGGRFGETFTRIGYYQKGESPYSVFDMAGNVWEWTADWYDADYYKNSPHDNPTGPLSGDERVLRGGSWADTAPYLRSTKRFNLLPMIALDNIGFRCVRPAK